LNVLATYIQKNFFPNEETKTKSRNLTFDEEDVKQEPLMMKKKKKNNDT